MSAWLAANKGDNHTLCRELDSGADLEFKDPMGRTPLMEAAKHGHVDCVHELLCRGADPTARSAVGWTALDFCGSHDSQHGEINRLLNEAQMLWQQDKQKQQQQHQGLQHQESNKENTDSQLQTELPHYSTPSPIPAVTSHMFRSYSSQDEPLQYRAQDGFQYSLPPQQQQQQLPQHLHHQQYPYQQQPSQPQQHLFPHPLLNPALSQGMLAQATLARLSQAVTEPANSSLSSSMLSLRSSDLSNVSNLSRDLGKMPSSGLHSPLAQHQQNPATLSKPVCRYWHSGRCLYGAHCRFAHPAGPAPTPPPSVQPVCRYWRFGTCRYGSACRFRHPLQSEPVMKPLSSSSVPSMSVYDAQLQQQRARNLGLTDAEVLSLLSQGSQPLQDTNGLLSTLQSFQRMQLNQR